MRAFDLNSLDAFFAPRSVAVIGASSDANKAGGRPIAFLTKAGFKGKLYPVNPRAGEVQGHLSYASVTDIDGPVDHAIVAVAVPHVASAVDACLSKGVGAITLFTAGFGETGADGRAAESELRSRCLAAGARLLGPNSLGLFSVRNGVFATFATALDGAWPMPGGIGLVSQSGAFGSYCFALLAAEGLGLSRFVATGNEADIDVAECIAWLARDDETKVIVAAMEGVPDGERLRQALLMAEVRGKPVVVMKVGATEVGQAAAASHTGSLAGSDAVFDAAIKEFGAVRVHTMEELIDLAYACSGAALPQGDRVGIITTSGGVGVVLADAVATHGLALPETSDKVRETIAGLLPLASGRNPVDTTAQILTDMSLFGRCLDTMLEGDKFDIVVIYLAHIGRNPEHFTALRQPLLRARERYASTLFVLCMLADEKLQRELFDAGFLVFAHPERAVSAAAGLYRLARNRARANPPVPVIAKAKPALTLSDQPNEAQSNRVLREAGIPMVDCRTAVDKDEAAVQSAELGYPVAMKVLSADIQHKSDLGGVRLGLTNEAQVREAYRAMIADVSRQASGAEIAGVLLSPMAPAGVETIIGAQVDPAFGPVVMFGLGGVGVELYKDVAFRLAPLGPDEAKRMIGEVRGAALLGGFRGGPACDLNALANTVARLSAFAAANQDRIASVEINPFLALPAGGLGLDALIVPRRRS